MRPAASLRSPSLRFWNNGLASRPTADLSAAVALAAEVGGPTARILVLSDHAPPAPLGRGQVEWWACGQPLANLAFTAATRTVSGEKERVLLEVANLSDSASQGTLTLEGGNLASARTSRLDLAAGAVRQVLLDLPTAAPPLRATLDRDALDIDNHVVLLPAAARPLRVHVDVAETKLRQAVVRALAATGQTLEVGESPDLVVSDKAGSHPEGTRQGAGSKSLSPGSRLPAPCLPWRLEILPAANPAAYAGPFVINHNHPLAQGLSLANALWSASPNAPLSGLPIITAGNVPLLTESEDSAGRRRLQMSFAAATSNLQDTPDWPIFFSNLVAWRRSGLPGMLTPNVRLGETAAIVLARDAKEVEVTLPDKSSRKLVVRGRRAVVQADRPGLYLIDTPDGGAPGTPGQQFSVNALSRDESDLTGCQTGRWGSWNPGTMYSWSAAYQDREIGLGWALLLGALALMTGHAALVARSSGGRGR